MVNYHDPATIAREFGVYAFLSRFRGQQQIYRPVFLTATLVKLWHVVDGIFM